MSHTKISQHNFDRMVLTELLPYEIPYRFNYDSLANNTSSLHKLLKKIVSADPKITAKRVKPLTFKISKGTSGISSRTLTLINPLMAFEWRDFYNEYNDVILSSCNRSNWSIRYPSSIAKIFSYRSTEWGNPNTKIEFSLLDINSPKSEIEYRAQSSISSFFGYSRYNSLSKFFDSSDLCKLELKFNFCDYLDVARCFDSIYTHSLSWAVRGKEEAKHCKPNSKSFDADFDKLMRNSNYGETAGLPIGPEISRIFAEIILQQCDLEIERVLESHKLFNNKDYTIRRYIDDFFIFAKKDHDSEIISKVINDILSQYNLYINTDKTTRLNKPFISDLSICKKAITELFIKHYPTIDEEKIYSHTLSTMHAKKFINAYRHLISQHSGSYKHMVPFTFGIIKRYADQTLQLAKQGEFVEACLGNISEFLEISNHLVSVNLNYRTTVLISEVVLNIVETMSRIINFHSYGIGEYAKSIITFTLQGLAKGVSYSRFEILNLFIVSRDLKIDQLLTKDELEKLFTSNLEQLNSIEICCLIYYYGKHKISFSLFKIAYEIVRDSGLLLNDVNSLCLALDISACPFCPPEIKRKISNLIKGATKLTNLELSTIAKQDAFFKWREKHSPSVLLQKKSLSVGYDC